MLNPGERSPLSIVSLYVVDQGYVPVISLVSSILPPVFTINGVGFQARLLVLTTLNLPSVIIQELDQQFKVVSRVKSLNYQTQKSETEQIMTMQHTQQHRFTYEYMTFDTQIPIDLRDHSISPPDLSKYTSPFEWSAFRKNICLFLCCATTFLASYSAGSYSIGSTQIRAEFNISNEAFQLGVTLWCVPFASTPMFLAPFSELNGRRSVCLGSGMIFFLALIGCAVTKSFAGLLVARFFVGASASTFAAIIGGVISDVYHAHDRNTPLALYSAGALIGTGSGPLFSGLIVQRTSWRWIFWHQVVAVGVMMLGVAIFLEESRGSVLLSHKAAKFNQYLDAVLFRRQNDSTAKRESVLANDSHMRYHVTSNEARKNIGKMLFYSLSTPFKLLFTEPVVFFFSLWASFAWGIQYLTLSVLPLVFRTNHDFTTEEAGATFASILIGVLLMVTISIVQEHIAKRYLPTLHSTPEGRLYFVCVEAILLPLGLFWFGWTSSSSVPWIVPCMAISCAVMGIFSIYLAVFNYLTDVYHRYASSALASQSFCRNILAGVFPLFSDIMFMKLGYPAAGSLLGGIGALLTIVPWVLVLKGEYIRGKSKIANEVGSAPG